MTDPSGAARPEAPPPRAGLDSGEPGLHRGEAGLRPRESLDSADGFHLIARSPCETPSRSYHNGESGPRSGRDTRATPSSVRGTRSARRSAARFLEGGGSGRRVGGFSALRVADAVFRTSRRGHGGTRSRSDGAIRSPSLPVFEGRVEASEADIQRARKEGVGANVFARRVSRGRSRASTAAFARRLPGVSFAMIEGGDASE